MARFLKWLMYLLGTLFSLLLILLITVRIYVGGIDVDAMLSLAGVLEPPEVSQNITVPEGFSIGVYAESLESPRVLLFSHRGDLLFSNPRLDRVEILTRDDNNDHKADGRKGAVRRQSGRVENRR